MNKRNKHYDVIVAWAAGEEVQYYQAISESWEDFRNDRYAPRFDPDIPHRIKPKKKEGWVNVYRNSGGPSGIFYATQAEADIHQKLDNSRVACVRIEWSEEDE